MKLEIMTLILKRSLPGEGTKANIVAETKTKWQLKIDNRNLEVLFPIIKSKWLKGRV